MRSPIAIWVLLSLAIGMPASPGAAGDTPGALPAPADSAAETQPLAAGSPIPEATIRALDGKSVALSGLHAKELRLLVFYRGGW
jgi:hypothetical protein